MSINSLCQDIVHKLEKQNYIEEISEELLSITSNDERVLYVYYIIRDLNLFPRVIEVHKTVNVSTHYRNLGNIFFQKSQDYNKAWQYYNLSLMHAPFHSDHYVLALANRSAVFFSIKKYVQCLQDIEKVLSLKYPDRLKDKLIKRRSACQEAMAENTTGGNDAENSAINDLPFMKGPKDQQYVCASTKLKVVCNREMGRHVVAKEDIRVGEILAEEDPYIALVLKGQILFSCSYCLSRNLNLLPCDNCCFALYCSKKCKEIAWQEYHKTECLLMPTLFHLELTNIELLALRTAIKARTDHEDWHSLFNTIEIAEAHANTDVQGCVKVNDKLIFDSKHYTSIHTLTSNVEKRSVSDIFQNSVLAAVLLKLLSDATDFINCEDDKERDKIKRCIASMLLLHIMTSPTNSHGIASYVANEHGIYGFNFLEFACALYAFHSLLNHSCAPDVLRFNRSGTSQMALFALRPIKKGMQVFDNYGYSYTNEDISTRQKTLNFQYKFTCHCEACLNNWPKRIGLNPARNLPNEIRREMEKLFTPYNAEMLEKGDKRRALEIYRQLCDLLEVLDRFAPCKELTDCQMFFQLCQALFIDCVPHAYSQVVEWKALPPQV